MGQGDQKKSELGFRSPPNFEQGTLNMTLTALSSYSYIEHYNMSLNAGYHR